MSVNSAAGKMSLLLFNPSQQSQLVLLLLLLLLLCNYLIIILSASYNLGCMLVAAAFISTGQNNQSDDNKV